MYQQESHVLCLENLKQAALYFDRVVPVHFFKLQGDPNGSWVEVPDVVPTKVISQLIYGVDTEEWRILEFMDKKWMPFIRKLHGRYENFKSNRDGLEKLYQLNALSNENIPARNYFLEFALSLGISSPNILIPGTASNTEFSQAYMSLSLDSIQLVNTDSASWEKIMELRKDKDSKTKLRNLRLFVYDNYAGKPRSFIEDNIAKRIEVYEAAAKKHGFELTTSVLSSIIDSKSIQAALSAGIGAAFFGGMELGIGAALSVEIGKVCLEIATREYEFREMKNNHELAYVIKARELFNAKC